MGVFDGKVAIVTGGGSGMGKEVATRFVAEGGPVVWRFTTEDARIKLRHLYPQN